MSITLLKPRQQLEPEQAQFALDLIDDVNADLLLIVKRLDQLAKLVPQCSRDMTAYADMLNATMIHLAFPKLEAMTALRRAK